MTTTAAILPHPTTVTMVWITCGHCGVPFGMAQHVYDQRRKDGASFFCTNGHERCYRESEADRLRAQLEAKERSLAYERSMRETERALAKRAKREAAAARGNITKLRRRALCGVCAFCNRSFDNLHRHMKTKHASLRGER